MITDPLQWVLAALGAFMVGVSKAGITGLSILSVALFTHIFPSSKQASGLASPRRPRRPQTLRFIGPWARRSASPQASSR
jgi:hypothetical protein